jgi:hypothetical protein
MNERICLTRSNWEEERKEYEDDVRGILLLSRWPLAAVQAPSDPWCDRSSEVKREPVGIIRSSETSSWAACLGLPGAANILGTTRKIGEPVVKPRQESK